jgi:hypothetical protein
MRSDVRALSNGHIPGSSDSVHAAVALLEAHVRLACCVSVAVVHQLTGLGTWPSHRGLIGESSALRSNVRDLRELGRAEAESFDRFVAALDHLNGDRLTSDIRNRAQHGNHLPAYWAALPKLVRTNELLATELALAMDVSPPKPRFGKLDLFPFIIPSGPQVAVLDSWGDEDATYWMFGEGPRESFKERVSSSLLFGIRSPTNLHRRHSMIQSILRDIAALDGRVIADEADDETLTVRWALPVLEGDSQRTDVFRLGAVPEWQDNDGYWRSFGFFFMEVLHWETLLLRLWNLAQAALDRRLTERTHLAPSFLRVGIAMPDEAAELASEVDFRERIVGAAETGSGGTAIVFLEGTAGAGKSIAMASCARELTMESQAAFANRAVKPAGLFVSSEGHLMANIDTAVSRVVDATPGLSASAVKALVRHGLLVLFIDGLDELLGDASYRHAIGTFSSWASGLAGSGAVVASARSSYFATAYMSDLSVSSSSINPELWRVCGLTDSQIQDVWRVTNDGAELDLASLSASALEALRVPFLCFEAAREFSGGVGSEAAVRASLINGYLQRERHLLEADGVPLVSEAALGVFLREVAEMLVLSGDRSLSDADLRLAAAAAGIEDESLLNRLRVMCGLAVQREDDAPRFVFGHDFYFDHFHALAVLEALRGAGTTADRLLQARSIERWALEPIISGMTETWCSEWLSNPHAGGPSSSHITRANLFLELINRKAAPPVAVDVAFSEASVAAWSGEFRGLDAEVLVVSDGTVLSDGRVRCLVLADSATTISIGSARVDSMRVGSQYLIGDEVRQFFASPHRAVPLPAERNDVQKLLAELERRQVRHPVVVAPDLLPNDKRMRWIDPEAWKVLMEAAQRSGVVELVKIESRGSRNTFRTRFVPPLIELADRDSANPRVQSFWSEVVPPL